MNAEPISVLVCALGGEGGGVLAEWLYDCAVLAGHSAQATSIPGVAQRTGATTYYIEFCPLPDSELGGRKPVFSLNPVPGMIDVLASSELLETVRQIGAGMASAERSLVITSSTRALTVAEKMTLGDGRQSVAPLLATVQRHARECQVLDMPALALANGTAVSAVLLGAIAGSGRLPFARRVFEDAIRHSGKGVDASLRGFAAAFDAVASRRAQQAQAQACAEQLLAPPVEVVAATPTVPKAVRAALPAPVHTLAALGHARLTDYQDSAYAALYLKRLQGVAAAERAADPAATQNWALTVEAARWLALWMAFDDIVRVAAHKASAARAQRVRREVGATGDEIVKVYDHFKPGVAEFAALLPVGLAQKLTAWDERRRARGLEPWALPIKLGSHTVAGALALRLLASLKGQRQRGSRFAIEQGLIQQWLDATTCGAAESWALGHELAQCGRLIKGYGSTNERGKANLLHIAQHLAPPRQGADAGQRAESIAAARQAALADEAGTALDLALVQHGAPPRALRAQPIRWYRRRPDMPVTGVAQR